MIADRQRRKARGACTPAAPRKRGQQEKKARQQEKKKRGQATAAGGRARPPPCDVRSRATFLSPFRWPVPVLGSCGCTPPPRLAFFGASLFLHCLAFLALWSFTMPFPRSFHPFVAPEYWRGMRALACVPLSRARARVVYLVFVSTPPRDTHTHRRKKKTFFFSGGNLFT